ncbi:malto-oligosyltrehalose trehalohydrolase [Taibaiella helva]|uniref:malto-oligosyltrehalose trehalohydrolase n=1 Tax=Taibaiella helva TaxID=2301235 RepID=UPI000E58BBE9|nr:malto-oligosyltrehalose trehalohydrolase [Taibaiella helva]
MNQPDIRRKQLGISFHEGRAEVLLWAPKAREQVVLHDETTGEHLPLERGAFGYWTLQTDRIADDDLYCFSIDGGKPLPDPASLSQPDGVHGPSQALDLQHFPWTDQQWHNPDFGDYIIYELHTGTFSEEGNFNGIMAKLGYLRSLGVNAIELMPVAQFPGRHNWGYDGVFPFAVQQSYGGARALQELVDRCHSEGIAVILDVVYNHLGPEGNYLKAYGPYFTGKYKTPWGEAINFDDACCDPVRRFFIENALMWLRDFHIDALRLDAVHAIRDFSPQHITKALNDAVTLYADTVSKRKYLIAETDLNDSRYIRPVADCGYGLRAQWSDEFHHALRVAVGQNREGYYADFNGLEDLAVAMKNAYVFTGQYSEHRQRNFGTPTWGISGDHFVVFAQNHDQVGNRMLGERLSQLTDQETAKLLAAVVLTAPFVPLLFMGEEWGASSPFLYFTDHSDKQLIQAVEAGRKAEFAAFQREGEPFPANAEATWLRSRLDWTERSGDRHETMFRFYRHLIQLRKTHAALKNYDRAAVEVSCDSSKEVLILERTYEEQHLYCLFNFSLQPHEVRLREDAFPLRLLLCSSDQCWMGPGDSASRYDRDTVLTLTPRSALILSNDHVSS